MPYLPKNAGGTAGLGMPQPAVGEEQPERPIPAFSLARTLEQVLPEVVVSRMDGKAYPVDTDFHTVLACLRRLADPDRAELDKRVYLAAKFYLCHPPMDFAERFAEFVLGGDAPGEEDHP